jgi:ribosomal protein S6--L-glutamate ligase
MRIAIIGSESGWHANDLMRAARDTGAELVFIDLRVVAGSVAGAESPGISENYVGTDNMLSRPFAGLKAGTLHRSAAKAWHPAKGVSPPESFPSTFRSLTLNGYDRFLVRNLPTGSLEQVVFRMDLLHQCLAAGTPVINPPRALETCVDKFLGLARLQAAGVPVPATIVCQCAEDSLGAFQLLGRDVVVKPIFGSEGRGLMRVTDRESAWRVFHALESVGSIIYLQEFIRHSGWDLRAFVVGGHVIAAMRRLSGDGWRTNISQGARAEPIELSEQEHDLAVRATRAVGALVAGVDILPGPGGERYVIEVNSCPGWRALSAATGIDVAGRLIQYVGVATELAD